jgi:hypothetical protein
MSILVRHEVIFSEPRGAFGRPPLIGGQGHASCFRGADEPKPGPASLCRTSTTTARKARTMHRHTLLLSFGALLTAAATGFLATTAIRSRYMPR